MGEQNNGENQVPNWALKDYSIPNVGISRIRRPTIQANNFEIKPTIIQMIQSSVHFGGLANDDPNLYIANFMEICDTFKRNGVSDDTIQLHLFLFSLQNKAKAWLITLPPGTITTWDELVHAFLVKYFPPEKTAKMRNDITNFMQQDQKSLYETWERYKDLLRKCPHHDLPMWMQVQMFYSGLHPNIQTMMDAASGGALMNKTSEEGYKLIEVMVSNNYMNPTNRSAQRRTTGIHNIDTINNLAAQVAILNNNFKKLNVHAISNVSCENCAGNNPSVEYQEARPFKANSNEQVNYVTNNQRNYNTQYNPNSNTFNQGWKNHPNFSWSNNANVQKPPPGFQSQEKKPNLEEILGKFVQDTAGFIEETRANFRNQGASIHNLEHQVGKISKLLAARSQGVLPSDTDTNPKEHVKAISLRSEKELESPKQVGQQRSPVVQPSNGASSVSKDQSNDPISIPNSSPFSNTIPFSSKIEETKVRWTIF
ncbi:hypothetical protein UlMin_037617 [Ulmus minor]